MTTINSQEEFLQALRDNPAWREAVRAELLGEEIPQLPTRFQALLERMDGLVSEQQATNRRIDELVSEQQATNQQLAATNRRLDEFILEQRAINQRMESFVAEQKAINQRMESFVAEQRAINQRMEEYVAAQVRINANVSARLDRFDDDISLLRAHYAQTRVRESAEAIAMEMGLYYVRTLTEPDLIRIYQKANGDLPRGQRISFQNADLVVETLDGDATVYITGEISYTADYRDSDRVLRNARLLKEYTGNDAIPTVLSVRNDRHVQSLVEAGEVTWHEIDRKKLGIE